MPYIIVEDPNSWRIFNSTNKKTLAVSLYCSLGKTKEFSGIIKEYYSTEKNAIKDLKMLEEKYPDRSFGIKKTKVIQPKKKYVGTFNWYGKIHTKETSAVTKERAKINLFHKLAEEDLKVSHSVVKNYYDNHPLGFEIKLA